jgi:hypothetical protein
MILSSLIFVFRASLPVPCMVIDYSRDYLPRFPVTAAATPFTSSPAYFSSYDTIIDTKENLL